MALVGPRSFKQAITFLIPFWILGEIFLGFIRSPLGDRYTGEVYVVTEKHGFPKPVQLNAKLDVELGDSLDFFDKINGGNIRLKFSGEDLNKLKQAGIDPAFLGEKNNSSCIIEKSKTARNQSFFAGFDNSYEGGYSSYSYATDYTLRRMPDKPNCHAIHIGVIDFDNIQLAVTDLNPTSFVFASLTRDSHIGFIQRMVLKLRYNRDDIAKL